eukprot:scaffold3685_cov242-Pinguiococcus_pyrenoidosus.AAC.5
MSKSPIPGTTRDGMFAFSLKRALLTAEQSDCPVGINVKNAGAGRRALIFWTSCTSLSAPAHPCADTKPRYSRVCKDALQDLVCSRGRPPVTTFQILRSSTTHAKGKGGRKDKRFPVLAHDHAQACKLVGAQCPDASGKFLRHACAVQAVQQVRGHVPQLRLLLTGLRDDGAQGRIG